MDKNQLSCFKEIFVKKIYDKKKCCIRKGENWYDFGGFVGFFSKYALLKGANIIAIYEPFEENNKEIIKNTNSNIKIINKLIGTENKKVKFYIHGKGNYQRNTTINHYKRIKMYVRELDMVDIEDIINQKNICIKMDIEGSELLIIDKKLDVLSNLKKLILEYHFDKDWNINNYYKRINSLKKVFKNVYYDKIKMGTGKFFPSGRLIYCNNEIL